MCVHVFQCRWGHWNDPTAEVTCDHLSFISSRLQNRSFYHFFKHTPLNLPATTLIDIAILSGTGKMLWNSTGKTKRASIDTKVKVPSRTRKMDFDDYFATNSLLEGTSDIEEVEEEFFLRVQTKRKHRLIKSFGEKVSICSSRQGDDQLVSSGKREDDQTPAQQLAFCQQHEMDPQTFNSSLKEKRGYKQVLQQQSDFTSPTYPQQYQYCDDNEERDVKGNTTKVVKCSSDETDMTSDSTVEEEDLIMKQASATSSTFFFMKPSAKVIYSSVSKFLKQGSSTVQNYIHVHTYSPDNKAKDSLWSF